MTKPMNMITIKVSNYFPIHFLVIGFFMVIGGVAVLIINPIASIILLILGILFTTTHYRFSIDLNQSHCLDYLWLFGLKLEKTYRFEKPSHLSITSGKRNYEYGPIAVRRYVVLENYKLFIKFQGEAESALLFEHKSHNVVKKKAEEYAKTLGLSVNDTFEK